MKFKVEVEKLENKIWREIIVKEDDTLADLVYIVMSTFELYFKDYFKVRINDLIYDSINAYFDTPSSHSAQKAFLNDLKLNINDKFYLDYSLEFKITFVITYLGNENAKEYPFISAGAGKLIDALGIDELIDVVNETDKTGESSYTIEVEIDGEIENEVYDYRDFSSEDSNTIAYINALTIKDDYESFNVYDLLRLIHECQVMFININNWQVTNPVKSLEEYIKKDISKLSEEELSRLPDYEDLGIYRMPQYKEINHDEITREYTHSVINKEYRKELFYVLRNHNFLDKFYDKLREFELFDEFLEYSKEYYQNIFNEWYKEVKDDWEKRVENNTAIIMEEK